MIPEPPADLSDLHALVVQVLAEREEVYPGRVANAKMTQEQADKGLRVVRAIEADWQRIVDLRNGRVPKPLDATATDFEKLDAIRYVHNRALAQLTRIVARLREDLAGLGKLAAIDSGQTTRDDLRDIWTGRRKGWPHREIGLFLTAEAHTWATEELLWYMERWPSAMIASEMLAKRAARDPIRRAA